MFISKVKIKGYKSLRDVEVPLKSGLNIILGINNSGKSAILECIALRQTYDVKINFFKNPLLEMEDLLIEHELKDINEFNNILRSKSVFNISIHRTTFTGEHFLDEISSKNIDKISIFNYWNNRKDIKYVSRIKSIGDQNLIDKNDFDRGVHTSFNFAFGGGKFIFANHSTNANIENIDSWICNYIRDKIYYCKASRNINSYGYFNNEKILSSDFSNIHQVICNLSSTPSIMRRLNKYINYVIPSIREISFKSQSENKVQIIIWEQSTPEDREDLAILLEDAGTGIGQVIGLLYLVITSKNNIIIVDEIGNFLHPSAAVRLMNVFQEFESNQYIIASHSTELITSALNPNLLFVYKEIGETKLIPVEPSSSKDMQSLIKELGSSVSELYAFNNIIWVEGPTEEQCLPKILEAKNLKSLNTGIISLKHTGDFDSKRVNARLIYSIYDRLSNSTSFLPKSVLFLLDREGRSENEMKNIEKETNNLVRFTPRRLFENYLIDREAICKMIFDILKDAGNEIEMEEIKENVDIKAIELYELDVKEENRIEDFWKDEKWKQKMHGARFIQEILNLFHIPENKPKHGSMLVDELIRKNTSEFDEILELITPIFNKN